MIRHLFKYFLVKLAIKIYRVKTFDNGIKLDIAKVRLS